MESSLRLNPWGRRFILAGIAILLAITLVGGSMALQQSRHARADNTYNFVAQKVATCLVVASVMGTVTAVTLDAGIFGSVPLYLGRSVIARLAISEAMREAARAGVAASLDAITAWWAANGKNWLVQVVNNCIGGTVLGTVIDKVKEWFPVSWDPLTNPDAGADAAAAMAADPNVVCKDYPGTVLDASGMCHDPNAQTYYGHNGTSFGPGICDGVPGTTFHSPSQLCGDGDNSGNYWTPDGTFILTCQVGQPTGDGNCYDPSTQTYYDPYGNQLYPQPINDNGCSNAMLYGTGDPALCDSNSSDTPIPDTPTPSSGLYDGQWYGAFTSPFSYENFILTVSGGSATFTLVTPDTPGVPDWNTYNFSVVGAWYGTISISDSAISGSFNSDTKNFCGFGQPFAFLPKGFILNLQSTDGTHSSYGGTVDVESFGYNPGDNSCPDTGPSAITIAIYR